MFDNFRLHLKFVYHSAIAETKELQTKVKIDKGCYSTKQKNGEMSPISPFLFYDRLLRSIQPLALLIAKHQCRLPYCEHCQTRFRVRNR